MADFFKWDKQSLGVDVKEMDDEHVVLIKKMNSLHAAYSENAPVAKITELLNDFVNYTVKHFADEEAYMEKVKFQGLDSHKIIHGRLLTQVTKHLDDFKANGKLTDDFFRFLSAWLSTHIRGIDVKYGPRGAEKAS